MLYRLLTFANFCIVPIETISTVQLTFSQRWHRLLVAAAAAATHNPTSTTGGR